MNWSRLGGATFDAVLVTFTLGAVVSPPDPLTQLLYAAPAFVVALPILYRYGEPAGRWWRRYVVFVGGFLACALAGRLLAFAVPSVGSAVGPAFSLVGGAVGAWLAFFGGLERLRSDGE